VKKRDRGLFDDELRLKDISKQGDPLERLNEMIKWSIFKKQLKKAINKSTPKGLGGRPPYDYTMMFKILILQRLYNLSDAQMQFQILDRFSFMRFLGLGLQDKVPDEKTIWHFREKLIEAEAIEKLFDRFNKHLEEQGLIANKGQIVDASFIDVPRQRNTREENKEIKEGRVPEEWNDQENKKRQKDVDARWTEKNGEKHYGYKDHIKVDKGSKIITNYDVTDASVHDSQPLEDLLTKEDKNQELYGDSAYAGKPQEEIIKKKKMESKIHEKGYRNKPLTKVQKKRNAKKSKIRVRVEHVFGFMHNSMNRLYVRTIGIERVKGIVGLMNLTYNICRYTQLQKA
jgi:IS5 family transposase